MWNRSNRICDWGACSFTLEAVSHYDELLRGPAGEKDSLRITKSSAVITEFLVKMGLGHWADANKVLYRLRHYRSGSASKEFSAVSIARKTYAGFYKRNFWRISSHWRRTFERTD
jgi:hypothetical protein